MKIEARKSVDGISVYVTGWRPGDPDFEGGVALPPLNWPVHYSQIIGAAAVLWSEIKRVQEDTSDKPGWYPIEQQSSPEFFRFCADISAALREALA